MMGDRGPAPKRAEQRRRTNEPAVKAVKVVDVDPVVVPTSDPEWHFVAKQWYDSLGRSGQSQWYSNSDWSLAYVTAESMSREFSLDGPPSAAALMGWLKACTQLLVCEGDRRRVGLELQRAKPADGEEGSDGVSWIDDARLRLHGTG